MVYLPEKKKLVRPIWENRGITKVICPDHGDLKPYSSSPM
jgi:hypothetical protein